MLFWVGELTNLKKKSQLKVFEEKTLINNVFKLQVCVVKFSNHLNRVNNQVKNAKLKFLYLKFLLIYFQSIKTQSRIKRQLWLCFCYFIITFQFHLVKEKDMKTKRDKNNTIINAINLNIECHIVCVCVC